MQTLLVSTGGVALAEVSDKTQLLAFILAARFKKPLPIILGIFAATMVNHGLAAARGLDQAQRRAGSALGARPIVYRHSAWDHDSR